jgi:hypothetical protein
MTRLRYNNQGGTLGADPGSSGGTITFAIAPRFATIVSPDYIPIVLDQGSSSFEIVYMTAYTVGATTGTVTRAAEDATNWPAIAHPGPGRWSHGPAVSDFLPGPDTIVATVHTIVTDPTGYTLTSFDKGTVVEMNYTAGVNLTIPTNATVPFPIGEIIQVCQVGAGTVTVVGPGVTIHQASSNTTRAQWSTITLRQRAADEWALGGDAT